MAKHRGNDYCGDCPSAMNHIELSGFIRVYVNQVVTQWSANDTFAICDGSMCTMYMVPSAAATNPTPIGKIPDPGTYARRGQMVGAGGGGDPAGNAAGTIPSAGFGTGDPIGTVYIPPLITCYPEELWCV